MSYSLEYYPDPGIAFDISKMLFVKLNSESTWQELLTSLTSRTTETTFIQNQASLFIDPDPEILLFTFLPSHKPSTFISNLILRCISRNFKSFSISQLLLYFQDTEQVKSDIFSFYLGEQISLSNDIERVIRNHKFIPDRIKILLFGFMLNPCNYISRLTRIIRNYYENIKKNYLSTFNPILAPTDFIDYLIQNTYPSEFRFCTDLANTKIAFSICYTIPDFLYRELNTKEPFFISTFGTIQRMIHNSDVPDTSVLINMATALSDKYRLQIIYQLIEKSPMTLQELANILRLSISATNNHIAQLKKANIVTYIRHGRTYSYSFCHEGFQKIYKALQIIEEGGKLL